MNTLLKVFVELCLLRAGPQQLPASGFLLGLSLVAYGTFGLLLVFPDFSLVSALGQVLLDALVLLGLLQLALRRIGHEDRFLQTATAATGSGALLALVALPVTLWLTQARVHTGDVDTPALLLFFLMIWNVAVLGHILRHALSTSLGVGVLLAIGYMLISLTVLGALFPHGS